jgi:Kef-type K+ transport system membrane component KefB
MEDILLLVGIAIALGFVIGKLTHSFKITAIVGYIFTGVILGNFIELSLYETDILVSFTLGLVAFVIGGELTFTLLRKLGRRIVIIILAESLGAFIITTLGIYLFTGDLLLALLFGSLAPASAPAGTLAVLHEYRAKGVLTSTILAVVGFDDGLAIIIYVFVISIVKVLIGGSVSASTMLMEPLVEIGGAIVLGILIGAILWRVVKRIKDREDILIVSLAAILICCGIARVLNFSLMLACLALGMTLINLLPGDKKPFEIIEAILPPIYVIFFVAAGMELQLHLLLTMGLLGVIYIVCRTVGKISGVFLSSRVSRAEPVIRKYLGFGILCQAGVAIGLALMAGVEFPEFPEFGALLITTIAATTVVFEIIGPIGVRYAITRAGEAS